MRNIIALISINAIVQIGASAACLYAMAETFGWPMTLGIFLAASMTGAGSALFLARR